jgi:hypothetical protein
MTYQQRSLTRFVLPSLTLPNFYRLIENARRFEASFPKAFDLLDLLS